MVRVPPTPFIRRKPRVTAPPAPPALELVTAIYSINDSLVTLTFNRAINIDDVDTHAFKIYDGIYANQILDGATCGADGDNGIIVYFDQIGSYSSATCLMNVSAGNGIKDAITESTWSGVSGYPVTIG